jgi:hypothetical protein
VDPRHAPPAEREQAAEHNEEHEREVRHEHQIGRTTDVLRS